jgi:hypothetical protein
LACPPETNVPALCGQLATVWSLIEGAPLASNRGDEPPEIPDAAILGVRETMDRMIGSYLKRRGKKRYCDKSLGTARFMYLLTRIWPTARFISVFRHPMDVIASGIEACPWGLNGYGFDPYISETPGNQVFALARFWADNAMAIMAAEEQYSDRCIRVQYESLVADPQAAADRIFAFLGADRVAGIETKIFAPGRERWGPADHKIWHTSKISESSVGRGWTVPADLIGPQVRAMINDLCKKLGYLPVDDAWGAADQPPDLLVDGHAGAGAGSAASEVAAAQEPPSLGDGCAGSGLSFAEEVGAGVQTGLSQLAPDFAQRWMTHADESFVIAVTPPAGNGPAVRWLVDLRKRTVSKVHAGDAREQEGAAGSAAPAESAWDIIGTASTWENIISGRTNLSVALRRHEVRYCDEDDTGPWTAEARIGMLGEVLGLTCWGNAVHAGNGARPETPGSRTYAADDIGEARRE